MQSIDIIEQLKKSSSSISARDAETLVPDACGLYSIFVDNTDSLPTPFDQYIRDKSTNMIYLGKATKSLQERLFKQDLLHKQPATFFRSLGAVLGYVPPEGSLVGMINQYNYKFSSADTIKIIEWTYQHVSIIWVEMEMVDVEEIEPLAINSIRPVLNTDHNPDVLKELKQLRENCRIIARGQD